MKAMQHDLKVARELCHDRQWRRAIYFGACSSSPVVRNYLASHLATWITKRNLDYFWEVAFSSSPIWESVLDFMVEIVIEIDKNK